MWYFLISISLRNCISEGKTFLEKVLELHIGSPDIFSRWGELALLLVFGISHNGGLSKNDFSFTLRPF